MVKEGNLSLSGHYRENVFASGDRDRFGRGLDNLTALAEVGLVFVLFVDLPVVASKVSDFGSVAYYVIGEFVSTFRFNNGVFSFPGD